MLMKLLIEVLKDQSYFTANLCKRSVKKENKSNIWCKNMNAPRGLACFIEWKQFKYISKLQLDVCMSLNFWIPC